MKTRDEILATWETEGQYADWYAIDSYDPSDNTINRLFVGTENDATDMMKAYYIGPTEFALDKFYRCSLISTSAALVFFKDEVDELDERSEYTITEAAELLGISRQRVHVLLQNGQLEGYMRGKTWYVYRYSIENRLSNR